MTVSKLREYMLEKVIPEKVMPQNIESILLSDGETELPDLDAFTFLNRLRALGIGSADFLYLLKGCGAPAHAIEQIERDPAMNLQSLIVTLDGSGLKSQDYTRMLYTARQLWERTLTMRLDELQAEKRTAAQEDDLQDNSAQDGDLREYSFDSGTDAAPAEEIDDNSAENAEFEVDSAETNADYAAEIPAADEGAVDEMVLENAETSAETHADDTDFSADNGEEIEQFAGEENVSDIESSEENIATEYNSEIHAADDADPQLNINARVFTETTQFLKADAYDELESEIEDETPTETATDDAENCEIARDEIAPQPRSSHKNTWHKSALVAAAVGAACVCAAAAWAELTDFSAMSRVHFAQDSGELFAQIYNSYTNGIIGGENAIDYAAPSAALFGNTLVESIEGCAAVTNGDMVYFQSESALNVYSQNNDELSLYGEITPPDGAHFISLCEENGAIYALFSGEIGGAMRIDNGEEVFIAAQDGVLTDISFEQDEIHIGTIYVPPFSQSFTAQETEQYLPSAGGTLIDPTSVLLCGQDGCAYAVAGSYSAENGALSSVVSIIGDPIFACADGTAALAAEGGSVIVQPLQQPIISYTGRITAWAREGKLFAFAEQTTDPANETGSAEITRIYLRDSSFSALSAFENLAETPLSLTLSDGILLAQGDSGVILCANCADPTEPALISTEKKNGVIFGGRALYCEITSGGILIKVIDSTKTLASFDKALSAAELDTLKFGSAECAFASGADLYGMAYSYFDGVSIVSEYAIFGSKITIKTLYDDKIGFTAAAYTDSVYLFKGTDAQQAHDY